MRVSKQINLIGIAGKAGSGKDTVTKMIQQLTSPEIPDYWEFKDGEWRSMSGVSPWVRRGFADKLKKMIAITLGVSVERFEDREFKKSILPKEWNIPVEYFGEDHYYYNSITVRQLMQRVGESIREGVHKDFWINALFEDYNTEYIGGEEKVASDGGYYSSPSYKIYPKWIISDVRYLNEVEAIKARGGIILRINRDLPSDDTHASEIELDDYEGFDWEIDNLTSLDTLQESTKLFLEQFKIL